MNQSERFIKDIEEFSEIKIPAEVMEKAKISLLDYIAVTSAGARFQKDKTEKYLLFSDKEEGIYTAIGVDKKVPLKDAVFLNGLNGHALDFDDGTNAGIIHIGSPIFSLLLPLSQKFGKSVEELLRAAIIGYEISYTLAVSVQPGHKALGYHATGTCGTIGAAIAGCYLLGFSQEEIKNAFAAACTASSGMLKVLDEGSELKPYNVAKASLLALTAIQLAKSGFKGPLDPLGGRGFIKIMTGKDNLELKPFLLNGSYAIQKTYTKPYASCRYTHPAVEAAVYLRNKYKIKADDITEVNIKTYSLAVGGHDHTEIPGVYSAKMSIPYSVAVGIVFGKAGLSEFSEETIKNNQIIGLTKKVYVISDEDLSNSFPKLQSAIVEIKTNNKNYTKRIDYPKGEPENPLTKQEFKSRFSDLTEYGGIDSKTAQKIFKAVYSDNANVSDILKNL